MSEPRKNRIKVDSGIAQEDEQETVEEEADIEFKTSKSSLSKLREKSATDGAEEQLLKKQKEDEAKIVTRVDMADAKYVVGDHRNGDANIEIDASKRQFTGLTKEELLKYVDDPFWVRLRWIMFVLFWALWLLMLAAAIAIIISAPKCAQPEPRTWYEKQPLVDMGEVDDFQELESKLSVLENAEIGGVFVSADLFGGTYGVSEITEDDKPDLVAKFQNFTDKAKNYGVKVIIDLTANFVNKTHRWFQLSENRTEPFTSYFIWAPGKGYDHESGQGTQRNPPNNWVSTLNEGAWSWSEKRKEFYLHQYGSDQPDLNFTNRNVVSHFELALGRWISAGASGIRLLNARQLIVNETLVDELPRGGPAAASLGATHTDYLFYQHRHTSDQPETISLMKRWSKLVDSLHGNGQIAGDSVFTLREDNTLREPFLMKHDASMFRPPAAGTEPLVQEGRILADRLNRLLAGTWPSLQLETSPSLSTEAITVGLLLPATPIFNIEQIQNKSFEFNKYYKKIVELREDASVTHGNISIRSLRSDETNDTAFFCARWKPGHTGYAVVWNPMPHELKVNASSIPSVPETLTIHQMPPIEIQINYTNNQPVPSDNIIIPEDSAIILSYVPNTTE